jgi:choline dehydrogenase
MYRRNFIRSAAAISVGLAVSPFTTVGKSAKKGFDYIIIGAGSSGCVIANRLTENAAINVLLLEAGGPDTKPEIHDASKFPSLWGSEIDWKYVTEEEAYLNRRKIDWPRGKVLGGTSAINAMIYVRGHFSNYDHWAALGNVGWSYIELLPYFIKLENNPNGSYAYHGTTGPLLISGKTCSTGNCTPFIQAAMELGYNGPDWDFNGVQQENGAGHYELTMKNGKRQSAATAFLTPILSRPNLTVLTFAQVSRLLFTGKQVTGVEYIQNGKLHKAFATGEVIVCAGAVETPKILMLSGIGAAEHVRFFNLKLIEDLPGVGKNLQDHAGISFQYDSLLPHSTLPLPECAGLFVRTKYATPAAAPDLQFLFFHLPADNASSTFRFIPLVTSPRSRGHIMLRSADPYMAPVITANYLQEEADVNVLIEGYKLTRTLANTRAFTKYRSSESLQFASDKQIEDHIRANASTLYHPVGTCKMGTDKMAVIQPDLTVYGIKNLRVADASIMPTLINANTNATCMMIGEYASKLIRKFQ